MTIVTVDTAAGVLTAGGGALPCAIGRGGSCAAADKREGDGMTPRGVWPIRGALLRPDRVAASATRLPWRWLRPEDGWSDDADDPAYNRAVAHPHAFSAERMWRKDGLYDVVVVLGHNDAPPLPGAGSAIFLHCWSDGAPTAGCVAIDKGVLVGMLGGMARGDSVEIV